MRRPLAGQVVVITGASSGIGRCTALYLAARGARMVLTARRAAALEDVVREIEAKGGEAAALAGEVTSRPDMRAVARLAVERFGTIDTWVNNAGVYIQGRVQDISLDEFRRVLDVDLVGAVNGTQCALEVMLPRARGVIVQVSSVTAARGVPFTTPYSAAKAGIEGFTSALRAELRGSGVRFSIVYPPTVDTPIYHNARGKLGVVPKPAPPVADPEEAARAIAELARTGDRHRYFGWSRALATLNAISPAAGDWLLHVTKESTYSDIPAMSDNIDAPTPAVPPAIRAGWSEPGWKGLTLREVVRVLPVGSAVAAGTLGFAAGAMSSRRQRPETVNLGARLPWAAARRRPRNGNQTR